eukprot:gene4799-21108_t
MGRPPPGTGKNPTTARPGSRAGVGGQGALSSMVQVADRPVTRQGLAGIKTQSQGPQRQVQDKSYWLGLLRAKINDLNSEVNKLSKDITNFNQENASYLTYEKRAENLATEIKELQGQLTDYNTLVDKLNTSSSFDDLKEDYELLKLQNEKETKAIDDLFSQRQSKEQNVKSLEVEIDQQRRMTESMVADMLSLIFSTFILQHPKLREKYAQLKKINLSLQGDLESKQQLLDSLNDKTERLEDEVAQSPIKQEAVTLYEKAAELEEKKASLLEEMERNKKSSPAEERERLLKQVKEDNQEVARIENRISEIKEKIDNVQEEIRNLDMDLEEHQGLVTVPVSYCQNQYGLHPFGGIARVFVLRLVWWLGFFPSGHLIGRGERTAKYKELKKREETMQEFLDTFEENKSGELGQCKQIQSNIVTLLERVSRALVQTKHMPNFEDFRQMKDDLNFKETEMIKSSETNKGLDSEQRRLQMDLEKVNQLESKITTELDSLKKRIDKMTEEIALYSDIDGVKKQAEEKRKLLMSEKEELLSQRETLKQDVKNLSSQYDAMKAQLQENETFIQGISHGALRETAGSIILTGWEYALFSGRDKVPALCNVRGVS